MLDTNSMEKIHDMVTEFFKDDGTLLLQYCLNPLVATVISCLIDEGKIKLC